MCGTKKLLNTHHNMQGSDGNRVNMKEKCTCYNTQHLYVYYNISVEGQRGL